MADERSNTPAQVVDSEEDIDVQMAQIEAQTQQAMMTGLSTMVTGAMKTYVDAQTEAQKAQREHELALAEAERPVRLKVLYVGATLIGAGLGAAIWLVISGHGAQVGAFGDFVAKLGAGGLLALVVNHARKK